MDSSSTEVTLHKATLADLPVVKNLVPYYMHDLSEHMGWPCNPDGNFDGCDDLETYWSEPGKHAFVLRAGNEPAGFVLILAKHDDASIDFSVTDFFVLRKFRGQGVGERIACQLFDQFPGQWKVEQFAANQPAVSFWEKVIGRYSHGNFQHRSGTSQWGTLNVLLFRTGEVTPPQRVSNTSMQIRRLQPGDDAEWYRMRCALWPRYPESQLRPDMEKWRSHPSWIVFIADRGDGRLGGFLELGQRPIADGCDSSPVAYIEGWYVDPDLRRSGVGRALVKAAEQHAIDMCVPEIASDCVLENDVSHAAHRALGYEEVHKSIHFRKALTQIRDGTTDEHR